MDKRFRSGLLALLTSLGFLLMLGACRQTVNPLGNTAHWLIGGRYSLLQSTLGMEIQVDPTADLPDKFVIEWTADKGDFIDSNTGEALTGKLVKATAGREGYTVIWRPGVEDKGTFPISARLFDKQGGTLLTGDVLWVTQKDGTYIADQLHRLFFDQQTGSYTGFENLPTTEARYTPDDAVADGCFVAVRGPSESDIAALYGGVQSWYSFLTKSVAGQDAYFRQTLFLGDRLLVTDYLYADGSYYAVDREQTDTPPVAYRYLRQLTGIAGSPAKETVRFVLTDSGELTFEQVERFLFSSSTEALKGIPPFAWIGAPTYIANQSDKHT